MRRQDDRGETIQSGARKIFPEKNDLSRRFALPWAAKISSMLRTGAGHE